MNLNQVQKPKLYSTAQVAAFMKVSQITVARMIIRGVLKAINVAAPGAKKAIYRVKAEDVQHYYDNFCNTTVPEDQKRVEDIKNINQ